MLNIFKNKYVILHNFFYTTEDLYQLYFMVIQVYSLYPDCDC